MKRMKNRAEKRKEEGGAIEMRQSRIQEDREG